MITDKQIRDALKKDFNNLYHPRYTADYEAQRVVREVEIEIMDLNNLKMLMTIKNTLKL